MTTSQKVRTTALKMSHRISPHEIPWDSWIPCMLRACSSLGEIALMFQTVCPPICQSQEIGHGELYTKLEMWSEPV